jgi:hypothetical protein
VLDIPAPEVVHLIDVPGPEGAAGAPKDADATERASTRAGTRRKNRGELPASLKNDELVNADQLAALIGVDKRTIFRWKAGGHLPDYDFQRGQTCRWKLSTVRMLIAQPQRLRGGASSSKTHVVLRTCK